MTDDANSADKDQGLLTTVAESIGSALGTLAAKASAAQKSMGKSTAAAVRKVTPSKRKSPGRKSVKSKSRSGAKKRKPAAKRAAKSHKRARPAKRKSRRSR
jgi:hypothetical protein